MKQGRIVVISDTHFGRPHAAVRDADMLRPLWQNADHLIVNGDAAEIHHPHHWGKAACQILKLYDFCEQDGVELTLLSGNHDPFLSDLRCLHLADEEVFITHGDVLHPAVAPWSPAAARMRRAREEALAEIEPETRDHLQSMLAVSQHASLAEWRDLPLQAERSTIFNMLIRPWAILRVLHYWRVIPRLAADFAALHAPQARFILIGHTHRPGIYQVGLRTIINTGSYGFPGTPRAVVIDKGELTVWKLRLSDGAYRLRAEPCAIFELGSTDREEQDQTRQAA